MSFSSGTYSLYATGNPVVTNTTISSTWANNTLNDIATALSTCLLKDGTQTATASIGFAQGIDVTTGITTPSTTFALANTTATTINFAGAATTLNVGAGASSTLNANFTTAINLNTAAIVSNQTTVAVINTTATTINAFGAASVALNIGHASAAAAFAGGISIPTGKTLSGAGAINISGNITGAAISGTTGTFSGNIAANAGLVIAAGQTFTTRDIRSDTGQTLNISAIGAASLALWTNAGQRLTIDSAGAVTIPGTLGVAGDVTLSSATANIYGGTSTGYTLYGNSTLASYIEIFGATHAVNAGKVAIVGTAVDTYGPLSGNDSFTLAEMTAPAGVANKARIFAVDNGSGKTVLKVIFGSGAAQVISTEP